MRRLFVLVSLITLILGWGFDTSALLTYSGETRVMAVDWGEGDGVSDVRAYTGMRLVVNGVDWRSTVNNAAAPPVIIYGRPMIPILRVLEECGLAGGIQTAGVSSGGTLKVETAGYELILRAGDRIARVNGTEFQQDWPPALINGELYVFARYIEMLTDGAVIALYPSYPDNIVLRRSNDYTKVQAIVSGAYERSQASESQIVESKGLTADMLTKLRRYSPLPFRDGGDELSQDLYLRDQPGSEDMILLSGRVMFGFEDEERQLLNMTGVNNICDIDIVISKGTGRYQRIRYRWHDADGKAYSITWMVF